MMKIHSSVGAVLFALFLVSAHEVSKNDDEFDDGAFDKAQAEFQSIIQKAGEPLAPLADPLTGIENEATDLQNISSKLNPASSHLVNSTSSFVIDDSASLTQVADESYNDNEVEGGNRNSKDDDDKDGDGGGEENGKEEREEEKTELFHWGRVPDPKGEASFFEESSRKLIVERMDHRRRGVEQVKIRPHPFEEAVITETTTTTGRYPLSYTGIDKKAQKMEYHTKHAIQPEPREEREMAKVWNPPDIYWHSHHRDGKPGKCEGRRRRNSRRRVCKLAHRRRRNHRRRRSHHRRRQHEYRRRRRRVHRRRRAARSKHRRRSHRRRLERGGDSHKHVKRRNNKREGMSKGPGTEVEKKLLGAALNAQSLIQKRSSVVMNWNKGITHDASQMLMRRQNNES